MGSKNCMNDSCRGTTSSSEWKKGWSLKSGGFATLCYSCGSAYENSNFCEKFHAEESGWRECKMCGKRVHCGCIASRYLHEYMDYGGIGCMSCVKRHEIRSMQSIQISGDIPNGTFVTNGIRDTRPIVIENRIDNDKFSTERLLQLTKAIGTNDFSTAFQQFKQEESMLQTRPSSKRILNLTQQCSPSTFLTPDNTIPKERVKDTNESLLPRPSLNFSLTPPLGSPNTIVPYSGGIVEGSELSKSNPQQGLKARQILPKPPKSSPTTGLESNKGAFSQTRIARPPAEGRGRNQLLPRYWPKITDQELQQLSGDLNSTIVPLFEKILSASDAGRIGRLVLPKACAEAYFPPINQSEGIPINIQDIKGKEWLFQFRFWPNNNSRMYVLEGVTPCIQDMQVQAGDTVIFSRIDPGGQLVIGCRKASNYDIQALQTTAIPSSNSPGETSFSGVTDNIFPNGGRTADVHMQLSEKKKARNIKNKRLLMHNDDAMELRVTWEEAQELLRPSPNAEPTFVMVEDHLFEEFEEPPIFGKRTIFTSRLSGEQEQLAQCDSCLKWRRLPVNALLSAKWTCSENIWDSKRSSCYAPEDINPRDLESIISIYKDSKKRRISDKAPKEGEPSGLDALATAAVLGDNNNSNGDIAESSSVGATTRHPRHRPGCSCIVCIQPPSGKGKHEPTCKCNVCSTVKRRFKTLMMRKKKRQSDREAELALAQMKTAAEVAGEDKDKDEDEAAPAKTGLEDIAGHALLNMNQSDKEMSKETAELDLNCDPHREEEILLAEAAGISLTTLMNAITLPLDVYLAQNGGPSVEQQSLLSKSGASESEEVAAAAAAAAAADGDTGQDNSRQDGGEPFKPI